MAWEQRERGGRYYTRSRREHGRVVREYVGTGPFAELVAQMDRTRRELREAERAQKRWELEKMQAVAEPILELSEDAEVLARAALLAGGYHKRKGEWRMRRA